MYLVQRPFEESIRCIYSCNQCIYLLPSFCLQVKDISNIYDVKTITEIQKKLFLFLVIFHSRSLKVFLNFLNSKLLL